jgi:hypothetical protein
LLEEAALVEIADVVGFDVPYKSQFPELRGNVYF